MIMSRIVVKCNKCGGIGICDSESALSHKANNCNGKLVQCNISCDDLNIISRISNDNDFFQAMIDLKENDIIEYNLKMSQFKSQLEPHKSSKAKNDNTPRCPHCKSTNIKPISVLNRGASIAVLGVFSKKINKSFECLECKFTW